MPALCSVRGPSAGRRPRVRASPAMYSVPACAQLQMHLACAARSGQAAHKRKPPLTATEPMQSLRTTAALAPRAPRGRRARPAQPGSSGPALPRQAAAAARSAAEAAERTLQAVAALGLLPHDVHYGVDQLRARRVVPLCPVVACARLCAAAFYGLKPSGCAPQARRLYLLLATPRGLAVAPCCPGAVTCVSCPCRPWPTACVRGATQAVCLSNQLAGRAVRAA